MTLDPTTRKQLMEARENIKAQLDDLEVRWAGGRGGHWRLRGPQDGGDIYDQLKQELGQVDEMLAIDPDKDPDEPGDEDPDAVTAAAAVESDYAPAPTSGAQANILASKVVVDDVPTWGIGRIVLILAVIGIAIAVARTLRIF